MRHSMLFAILFAASASIFSCSPSTTATAPFYDGFQRKELGDNWSDNMGGGWDIKNGMLHNSGANNSPLWLKLKLPDNAVIEFDAYPDPRICDIKCEAFADGRTHATGYIFLMGGWKNTISAIARLDEHQPDRIQRRSDCVPGKSQHWRIERQGNLVKWYVDDNLYLQYNDPKPLYGRGHDRFAFNNWQSEVYFDNLNIRELE